MAGLSGIAAGAAVGGLTGALVGMGVPELEAKMYEGQLKEGNILMSVHTDDSAERTKAENIMKGSGREARLHADRDEGARRPRVIRIIPRRTSRTSLRERPAWRRWRC